MRIASFALLTLLLHGIFSYLANLPQDIGLDVPDGKLNSLSFAPFREGQSPLLLHFPSPEQIDEDLKLLSDKTHTIRTYSSSQGMKVIPKLARKHELKMIQGAWIGYLPEDARIEIEELVAAANAYPDVIKRVIVGNEVLLRGERKPEELAEYIREVKQRIKQPVSYADVWSMYMKHPDLIKEVDFITIHILPYWEDEPIPVEKAPEHIERIYKQVQKEAESISPGKPILIGESGWPSIGRQRGWAVPGVVNEAAFIRGLLKVAADNHFDVNIVEAFNQSWKSELEGVIGANWGLFSVDREEVFPLTGKVYENQKWLVQCLIASILMALIALAYAKKLQNLPANKILFFLLFAQILTALFVYWVNKTWYTSYDDWQRLRGVLVGLLNITCIGLLIERAFTLLSGEKDSEVVNTWLEMIYLIVIASALLKTYFLAIDGRYVSFPFEAMAIPIIGLMGLWGIYCLFDRTSLDDFSFNPSLFGANAYSQPRNRFISWLLLFYSAGLVFGEIRAFMMSRDFIQAYPGMGERFIRAATFTLTNGQLMIWLASLVILALSLIIRPKHV